MTDDPAITLHTADGVPLEARLDVPPGPWARAVVCHPHPSYGGSMQSPVNQAMARHLVAAGAAVMQFNFRGVGRSGGTHGDGRDERLDVRAALDALVAATPEVPLVLAGWSFGADVCAAIDDPVVDGWFLVAPPLSVTPPDELAPATADKPAHLMVPAHDQFRPPETATEIVADWPQATVEVVAGADHFLTGRLAVVANAFEGFVRGL